MTQHLHLTKRQSPQENAMNDLSARLQCYEKNNDSGKLAYCIHLHSQGNIYSIFKTQLHSFNMIIYSIVIRIITE